jgi:hypothetical protein
VLTAPIVAVKLALMAPEAIVTDDGTVTAALLLARFTTWPPLPATAVSVAVQLSIPAPVIDPLSQLRYLTVAHTVSLEVVPARPLESLLDSIAPPHASRFTERKDTRSASKTALRLSFRREGNRNGRGQRLGTARLSFGETIVSSAFLRERAF